MKLTGIEVTNVIPLKSFVVTDLADVVVIGGPNGVGKTRLLDALKQKLSSPQQQPNINLLVQATSDDERKEWGKQQLDTRDRGDADRLHATLTRPRPRARWVGGVIYFENNRTIGGYSHAPFTWDTPDPWEEHLPGTHTLQSMQERFNDTLQSLFKKVQNQWQNISQDAVKLMRQGAKQMDLNYSDPLAHFRAAFAHLLAPKELGEIDARTQNLTYRHDGKVLPIFSLSSGEMEVVNIVFDLLLRSPQHCIIVFDEPELHLHPELAYRLLQTLRTIGKGNQFIMCTHSPEIISAAIDQSVVFMSPPKPDGSNQAVQLAEGDETYQTLKLLGQSVGVISLAKKIVLVEGTDASLDKQLYGSILRRDFPEFVLVPAGNKTGLGVFSQAVTNVLNKTIWGVDFYMICDGDAAPSSGATTALISASKGRLAVLPRYHLENYLLDEYILAAVFAKMEDPGSWLTSPSEIRQQLRECAKVLLPYSTALIVSATTHEAVGNADILPKDCHGKPLDGLKALVKSRLGEESRRITAALDWGSIERQLEETYRRLSDEIDNDGEGWKRDIPGKPLFQRFASKAKMLPARLKTLYMDEVVKSSAKTFDDIHALFTRFRALA